MFKYDIYENYNVTFLLRKNEYFSESYEKNGYICWDVLKEMKRIIRRTGTLRLMIKDVTGDLVSMEKHIWYVLLKILIKKKTPIYSKEKVVSLLKSRSKLLEHEAIIQIDNGIKLGFLSEWMRYNKDGRTLTSIEITIGPEGYLLIEKQQTDQEHQFETWKSEWLSALKNFNVNIFNAAAKLLFETAVRQKQTILESGVNSSQLKKHQLYFQFLIHLIELHATGREEFDWKEIGAVGYQEIGGSKMYDQEKEWLLQQLQEDTDVPLDKLGFVSLGQIVPIYYSGSLSINDLTRISKPLGALTDYEVQHANVIQTNANFIIITENRSPLVKMAVTGWIFSKNALAICCDGQIRSAHRVFIQKVISKVNNNLPIYIWVDYDKSGLDIARTLQTVVGHTFNVRYLLSETLSYPEKWGNLSDLEFQIMSGKATEQEQMLGTPTNWDAVFK